MAWKTGWSNATQVNIIENGGGDYASNYNINLDIFYNCPAVEADSVTQFLYRPAYRYEGTDNRVYVITCATRAPYNITIKYMDEEDGTTCDPITLASATGFNTHNGGSVIILQKQTGALAGQNGTVLTALCDFVTDIVSIRSDQSIDSTELDSLTWGAENTIATPAGAEAGVSYPYLIETDDGVIFCFYKRAVGDVTHGIYYKTLALDALDPDDDVWSSEVKLCGNIVNSAPIYFSAVEHGNDIHFGLFGDGSAAALQVYQDIYYIKKTGTQAKSTDTAGDASKLTDSAVNFTTMGVAAGWRVLNTTDNTHSYVTAVDSDHVCSINDDIMDIGESYILFHFDTAAGGLKQLPLDNSDADHTADVVHTSVTYDALWDCYVDSSGNPYLLYFRGADTNLGTEWDTYWAYYSAGWNEEKITVGVTDIVTRCIIAGGWLDGGCFKGDSEHKVFISVPDGSNYGQIQAYERVAGTWYLADGNNGTTAICDDGLITQSSPGHNFRPSYVRNAYKSGYTTPQYSENMWFYQDGTYVNNGTNVDIRFAYPGFENGKYIGCKKKCRSDFGDIRFTTVDGKTALNSDEGRPWFESKTDSWRAYSWIGKFSIIAVGGTTTIYAYYGAAAETNSNDQDVLEANWFTGDHFENGVTLDLTQWTVVQGAVTVAAHHLLLTGTGGVRGLIQSNTVNFADMPSPVEIRSRFYSSTSTPFGNQLGMIKVSDLNERAGVLLHAVVANQLGNLCVEGGVNDLTNVNGMDVTNPHTWSVIWDGSQTLFYSEDISVLQTDRVMTLRATNNTHIPEEDQVLFAYEGTDAGEITYVDFIVARPHTSPEPIVGAVPYTKPGGTRGCTCCAMCK